MRKLILLIILMVLPQITFAEIPKELQDIATKFSFLTSTANRCNTRLEIMGKKGITTEHCIEFTNKAKKVFEELLSKEELFIKTAKEIDGTSSMERGLEWKFFFNKFNTNLENVNKVQKHIKFLSD